MKGKRSKGWFYVLLCTLVLTTAVSVKAATFTLTGDSVIGFRTYRNLYDPSASQDHVATTWTQTNRFSLKVGISEDLYALYRLDLDVFPNVWGTEAKAVGGWDANTATAAFKAANVNFKIPGIKSPTWVRVGLNDWLIRPNVFLNVTTGPGIQVSQICDMGGNKLTVSGGWGKIREYDEKKVSVNLFYGLLDYKVKGNTFGLYALTTTGEDDTKNVSGNIWWLGLYSDGKIGPLGYNFDLIFDTGKEDAKVGTDYKYSGWFARAVVTYPYEKFTFGLGGLYVSGDNYEKYAKGKVRGFVLPYKSGPMGPAADSLIVISGWEVGPGPAGDVGYTTNTLAKLDIGNKLLASEGWPGIWGLRLFAYYKVSPSLTLAGQICYWGDTSKKGDSLERLKLPKGVIDKDEDSIGWEVNVGAKIDIYKNLTLRTVFGYLFAGEALDCKESGKKMKDPFAWVTTLVFTY